MFYNNNFDDTIFSNTLQHNDVGGGASLEWQNSWGSVDNAPASPTIAANTLSPNTLLAAKAAPHPRMLRPSISLGVGRIFGRKGSTEPPARSASDEKSDVSEVRVVGVMWGVKRGVVRWVMRGVVSGGGGVVRTVMRGVERCVERSKEG